MSRVRLALAAALILTVLLELVFLGPSKTMGGTALYGLLGCAALVGVAKGVGKLGLTAPEPREEGDEP
jgi:hypothetical protein